MPVDRQPTTSITPSDQMGTVPPSRTLPQYPTASRLRFIAYRSTIRPIESRLIAFTRVFLGTCESAPASRA